MKYQSRFVMNPAVAIISLAALLSVASRGQEAPAQSELPAPVIVRPDPAVSAPVIPNALPGETVTTPPPAPAPPPIKVEIPQENTLTSETHDHGDHSVTVQEVLPIELPPEPAPAPPPVAKATSSATLQKLIAAHPVRRAFMLSGTVYDHRATLVRCQGEGPDRSFEVWSNIDFGHLRHIGTLRTGDDEILYLNMGLGDIDTDLIAARWARRGLVYQLPVIPALPADADSDPAFTVTKGDPTPDELAPLLALHALYKVQHARLKAATTYIEQVNAARREWEKTHPPQPEDIVIKHWNSSGHEPTVEPTPSAEGGAQ